MAKSYEKCTSSRIVRPHRGFFHGPTDSKSVGSSEAGVARTRDLRILSPLVLMRLSGLEPETYGLKVRCSTN